MHQVENQSRASHDIRQSRGYCTDSLQPKNDCVMHWVLVGYHGTYPLVNGSYYRGSMILEPTHFSIIRLKGE